jgi:hypothetical protein
MTRKSLIILLFCALFTLAAQSDKSYRAGRFDVDATVNADGSLVVEETVSFRFDGGPFTFVFRELPTDHTDGITDIVAGVDGVAWPPGTEPGQVEITGRNPIEITWHLPPTSNATQTFNLSYRALGVARRGETADTLDWQALPDEYDYAIDASAITFHYPATAELAGDPELLSGSEAWRWTADETATTFTADNLSPDDPFVARLSFAPGFFTTVPAWQAQQAAQNRWAWPWIAAGALILFGGLLAVFRAARPYSRSIPAADSYLYKPPQALPPALAGYLANTSIGWYHGLATLFDLAGRGLIEFEQTTEKSTWRSAEFAIRLLDRPGGLRPHEQALVDLLFTDRSGVESDEIMLSDMGRLITSSRWKGFTEILEEEAGHEGLTDPAAKQRRGQLIGWGVVIMLLASAGFIAVLLLSRFFGAWPLFVVGAALLVGFIAAIAGATLSPLSKRGAQLAVAFEPFRRFLKDVTKNKIDLPDPSYYEAHLPYATAYGLAEPWVKRQAQSDYQDIPAYVRAASGANMAVFVAIIAATSHSGGAAAATAGAAGAAAAGGGASGAG